MTSCNSSFILMTSLNTTVLYCRVQVVECLDLLALSLCVWRKQKFVSSCDLHHLSHQFSVRPKYGPGKGTVSFFFFFSSFSSLLSELFLFYYAPFAFTLSSFQPLWFKIFKISQSQLFYLFAEPRICVKRQKQIWFCVQTCLYSVMRWVAPGESWKVTHTSSDS